MVSSVFTDHEGNLKVRKMDGKWLKISHEDDLVENFSNFSQFTFN